MVDVGRRITTNSYIPVNITPSVAVSNSRPSGRPRKEITLPTPAVIAQFELLIHVILPDKVTRTANRKTKTTKQDPLKFGPKDADTNLPWDGFLGKLAEMVQTGVKNLVVASFEWHFLKPTTSPKLPINSPNGFQSMMKQILGKNGKKDGDYIIVRMMPPTKEQSVAVVRDFCSHIYIVSYCYPSPGPRQLIRSSVSLPALMKTCSQMSKIILVPCRSG